MHDGSVPLFRGPVRTAIGAGEAANLLPSHCSGGGASRPVPRIAAPCTGAVYGTVAAAHSTLTLAAANSGAGRANRRSHRTRSFRYSLYPRATTLDCTVPCNHGPPRVSCAGKRLLLCCGLASCRARCDE